MAERYLNFIGGSWVGAEVRPPFGAIKETGSGHREASHTVLDTFSEWKSIYGNFSGKLQKAQIDVAE